MDDELVQALQEFLGARLALAEEDRIERRRYALLQAAAIIYSGSLVMVKAVESTGNPQPFYWENFETAADSAKKLLTEIEKREKEEAER